MPAKMYILRALILKKKCFFSSIYRSFVNASVDLFCVDADDEKFLESNPREHVGQLIQRVMIMRSNYFLYFYY